MHDIPIPIIHKMMYCSQAIHRIEYIYIHLQTAVIEKAVGKAQNGRMGPVVGKHNSLVRIGNFIQIFMAVQFMESSN